MSVASVIAMPRTGHHAVMRWLEARDGGRPRNVEGRFWDDSLESIKNMKTVPILVIRDYPNWAASVLSYFTKHVESDLERYVAMWISHVENAYTIPTIRYDLWLRAGHGKTVLDEGSMFEGGSRLNRYEQSCGDSRWPYLMGQERALELSYQVFGRLYVGDEVAA